GGASPLRDDPLPGAGGIRGGGGCGALRGAVVLPSFEPRGSRGDGHGGRTAAGRDLALLRGGGGGAERGRGGRRRPRAGWGTLRRGGGARGALGGGACAAARGRRSRRERAARAEKL